MPTHVIALRYGTEVANGVEACIQTLLAREHFAHLSASPLEGLPDGMKGLYVQRADGAELTVTQATCTMAYIEHELKEQGIPQSMYELAIESHGGLLTPSQEEEVADPISLF